MKSSEDKGSLTLCDNPLCSVAFEPTCLPWNTQKFCSGVCRQQASIIKRAAKLLEGVSDQRVIEIVRSKP
jgi:hypothetical protein